MKGIKNINIIVAESSTIIRNGLIAVLKRLPNFNVQASEIVSMDALHHAMRNHEVDIAVINPVFGGWFDINDFKNMYSQTSVKVIAIISHLIDANTLKDYDANISLFDSIEAISETVGKLMQLDEEESDSEQESLSQREKEIICYVVKGLTNKEIAENLFISVHTVITHRRNISRKLQIHSPAGLTIYAIVNKLVDIKEVKLQ